MAQYQFKCKGCGVRSVASAPLGSPPTPPQHCDRTMVRDYQGEGVQTSLRQLKLDLRPDYHDSIFLPTQKDFESPTDPDGSKGLAKWNENHTPKEGNKNPKRPKPDHKTVFAVNGTTKE